MDSDEDSLGSLGGAGYISLSSSSSFSSSSSLSDSSDSESSSSSADSDSEENPIQLRNHEEIRDSFSANHKNNNADKTNDGGDVAATTNTVVDGTLFNGVNLIVNVLVRNVSVCFILDEVDLDAGTIENTVSSIDCQIFSSKENEFINLSISHIESRACNVVGSSFGTNLVSTVQLPFKPAVVVEALAIDYKGYSRDESFSKTNQYHR